MSRKKLLGALVLTSLAATVFLSTPFGLQTVLKAERLASGLSDQSVLVNETFWTWSEKGQSAEPLVLLHGFAGNRNHWVRVTRQLGASHRILIPDLPGFGDSSPIADDPEFGVDIQLTRLIQWLDALGLKKVHIGGHSMGGRLAFLLASRYPDRVKSLYLMCPSGITQGRDSAFHRKLNETGINLATPIDLDEFDALNELAFEDMPWIPRPLYYQLGHDLLEQRPRLIEIWDDLKQPAMSLELLTASLPAIPITTLWGAEDRLLNPSVLTLFKSALPKMRDELLPGIGHMPLIEAPTRVAESISGHLNTQSSQ